MAMSASTASTGGNLLTNLRLKTKLFGGFGAMMAILVAVSAFGYFGFVAVSGDVDRYTKNVEEAALTAGSRPSS